VITERLTAWEYANPYFCDMKQMLYIAIVILLSSCNGGGTGTDGKVVPPPDGPKSLTYSIGPVYPHDTSSFTEGLLIYKGEMYESTGEKGRSKLLKIDLQTGKILQSLNLDSQYFGEGIAILNDTIYQLTYQEKVGFMYSLKDFKKLKEFTFASPEGWGMTTDGKEIIATDGSSNLHYYQPGTFRLLRTQAVTESGTLAYNLNELEYIDGFIYANQWQAPYILKIDPSSGAIVAKADITDIWNRVKGKDPSVDVPNGIAYDPTTKKIYITGKRWPELYEIEFSK
jgi:glutamine cyclotransferase